MNPKVVSRLLLASKDVRVVFFLYIFLAENKSDSLRATNGICFADRSTGLQSFAVSHVHGAMKPSLSSEKESGIETISPLASVNSTFLPSARMRASIRTLSTRSRLCCRSVLIRSSSLTILLAYNIYIVDCCFTVNLTFVLSKYKSNCTSPNADRRSRNRY